ncbi:MAG TPA: M1 family metallopeptidase [Verrucomicrobiae bacterium]|nr:M1 family metallopeptidase [Verrucomicrobiae bacterium]
MNRKSLVQPGDIEYVMAMEHQGNRRLVLKTVIGLWFFLFLAAPLAFANSPFIFASTPGKLPKEVVPHRYEIRIQPDLDKLTTTGSVIVDLEFLHPAREIVFNVNDLKITKATLLDPEPVNLLPHANTNNQTVALKLPQKHAAGKSRLALEFTGRIGEQAQGLFYVKYNAPSGKKIMLGTQMEPTDARRMFPCWDEPAFRATYQLTAVLPEKFKAFSNLPIEQETPVASGLKETRFATTPPMSSYLVVLVAGELESISDEVDGVKIRVVTTEGKSEQGRYALDATKKLLHYYNDYFGIKYPLPKLDQIAIPGGFDGAMENWGAITYNESVLLFDPKTSSPETQRGIFVDVAHEMAHQWFGNLVTTAWWDDLWLNEGFASWMENKATDHFNPDWQMWLAAASDKTAVMSGDAHSTTHPIQQAVANESEANDAFDSITYEKGSAFLRMLEAYLGPDEFRRGIQHYLSGHLYSNATTADLWDALENISGKPIRAISTGWTEQPGLPLVSVKAKCSDGRQVVSLEQRRFTVQDPHSYPLRWEIPMTLVSSGTTNKYLLKDKSAELPLGDCLALVKANAGDTGYYRVQYSPALNEKLLQNLNSFSAADRLNLLNDSWALVEAGKASSADYFAFVGALRDEQTFAIWDEIISTCYLIDDLEQGQPGRKAFQQFVCSLLRQPFQEIGWMPKTGEPFNQSLLRGKVIGALGHFGDAPVIVEAKNRFAQFVATPDSLPPSLRPAVLRIGGRYADKPIYDHLHELARNATGTEERELYYGAMGNALDPELARETLALSLTNETIPQEATYFVIMVATQGEHKELAWNFARDHMPALLAKVDGFNRDNYVPSIFGAFSDDSRAEELLAYVKHHVSADAVMKAREAAEEIRFKAMLKKRELPVIDNWVATH